MQLELQAFPAPLTITPLAAGAIVSACHSASVTTAKRSARSIGMRPVHGYVVNHRVSQDAIRTTYFFDEAGRARLYHKIPQGGTG